MNTNAAAGLEEKACASCGGTAAAAEVCSDPPGETQSIDVLTESWFGFFKKKVFFTYHRCRECGLLYNRRYFTDEALGRLYSRMPDNTAGVDPQNLQRTQDGYLGLLGKGAAVDGDYLELGPDIGLLTATVAPRVRGKLWLFEPNRAVHEALSRATGGRPHVISAEMQDFSAVPDRSVSLCVLIHVLDHLPHARDVMRALASKLKPGGRVLIVTHDERSFLARILGRRWPAFCLQHPHLFNSDSTERFLRSCGLRTEVSAKTVNYFPALYLAKHLLYAMGIRAASRLPGGGPALGLRLGNRATIAGLV